MQVCPDVFSPPPRKYGWFTRLHRSLLKEAYFCVPQGARSSSNNVTDAVVALHCHFCIHTLFRNLALLRYTQLPRDGHASFTRNDQFAVTPTFRRRPRNAGNSDQTFPFPGTSGRARLPLCNYSCSPIRLQNVIITRGDVMVSR